MRMLLNAKKWINNDDRYAKLGVSSGIAIWDPACPQDKEKLLIQADDELYREKAEHKSTVNQEITN